MDNNFIIRLVKSAREIFREGDSRVFLQPSVSSCITYNQRIELLAIDLAESYQPSPYDSRFEIRKATSEDLALFRFMSEGSRSEFYRDKVDGAEPFVTLCEGWLAHIAWIYDSRLPTRFIRLKPGPAELRYGYTCQEFHGQGLYGATNAFMLAELAKRGYKRVYGHVVEHTVAFRMGLEGASHKGLPAHEGLLGRS